jgi:hypothetical protein
VSASNRTTAWQEIEGESQAETLERLFCWLAFSEVWQFDEDKELLRVEAEFPSLEQNQDWSLRVLGLSRELGLRVLLFHDCEKALVAIALERCLEERGRRFVAAVTDLTAELTSPAPN